MNRARALKQFALLQQQGTSMRLAAEEWKQPWQTLISTVLSARTRDEMTIPVAGELFKKYPTVKKLADARLSDVKSIIRPLNFYKTKAKHIVACAHVLVRDFKGDPPLDVEQLLLLPGVGRKTANVFLSERGMDEIGVDTHVYYISRFLGWSTEKNPHKVEQDLKKLFPQSYWIHVNSTLVRFGKTYTSRREKDALLTKIKKV